MNKELVMELHKQKYQDKMSVEDYAQSLDLGFELIRTSGVNTTDDKNRAAINLALEYNMELMVNYLSM
jgi:hypothetical protein